MLVAHLVPGYFAAALSQPRWDARWRVAPRVVLWGVALGSTIAPDLEVFYNVFFNGFINHNILWTHSIFLYLGIGAVWLLLYRLGRWRWVQFAVGLIAIGGLSHIFLDVISHGTPLFYPLSMTFVGIMSRRVMAGGFWAYITDPIFLLEPLLLALACAHWILQQRVTPHARRLLLAGVACAWASFSAMFIIFMPTLQRSALNQIMR